MKTSSVTQRVLEDLSQSLQMATNLPISFEIQEDGKFLLVSVDGPKDDMLGERVAALVDRLVPGRPGNDSWMVVFTQGDEVVESYSGGNL